MEAHTKLWYLENFSLLQVLSKEEIKKLDKLANMINKSIHQVLYFPTDEADTLYILKGKEIILAILGPGEIFGELAITGQSEKREEIAEITEDAVLCMVNISDIKEMMSQNPKFNMALLKLIGLRLKQGAK